MVPASLRLGTSSWSAKGWVGPFYPPRTPPGDFLAHYARRYSTVEADVTYYRVPDQRLVDGWARALPESFRMCAKFPRTVVHGGAGPSPDAKAILDSPRALEDCATFVAQMSRLGERLGPLLVQFPYFNRGAFPSPEPFLARLEGFLARLPAGLRVAVEVRNDRWIQRPLLELLQRHRAAFCLVDHSFLSPPWTLAERLGGLESLLTADFAYARLIGDRDRTEALTQTFDRTVVDQSERIARWAPLLAALSAKLGEVYTFVNNHFAGYAPATVDELATRVGACSPP